MNALQTLEQELIDNRSFITIIQRNPNYTTSQSKTARDKIVELEAQIREIKININASLTLIKNTFLADKWKSDNPSIFTKVFANKETDSKVTVEALFLGHNAEDFYIRFNMTTDSSLLIGETVVEMHWDINDSNENNINKMLSKCGKEIVLHKEEFEITTPKTIIVAVPKQVDDLDAFKSRLIHGRVQVKRILKKMLWTELGD